MKALKRFFVYVLLSLPMSAVAENIYYINDDGGLIDYYGSNYENDLEDTYYINIGSLSTVEFEISIDIEENNDYLYIYNIDLYGNETLIATLTGNTTDIITTTSHSGRAKISYVTDGSVSYYDGYTDHFGYLVSYSVGSSSITQYDYLDKNLSIIGKLGVGTRTPQEKLHVNGPVRGHGTCGALQIKTDHGYVTVGPQTASYGHLFTDRPAFLMNKPLVLRTGVLSSFDNNDLSLQTAGQTRLTVDTLGHVGIGTSSPQYNLDVKGRIRATEVIIHHIDSFPDYVFRPGYELRTVDETDSYIREHGHLPGLPSAAEAEQQGVSLSRLQLQLLEKVEELTLYVISQQRMLERQQALIERQQREIVRLGGYIEEDLPIGGQSVPTENR